MKALISYASSKKEDRTEYIDTLEDLLAIMKLERQHLIISPGDGIETVDGIDMFITVYDGYIE